MATIEDLKSWMKDDLGSWAVSENHECSADPASRFDIAEDVVGAVDPEDGAQPSSRYRFFMGLIYQSHNALPAHYLDLAQHGPRQVVRGCVE